jgi:hypothetical protein
MESGLSIFGRGLVSSTRVRRFFLREAGESDKAAIGGFLAY